MFRVILTLGSQADFSEVLRDLEREVSPLWAFRNCPRDFKKTSAERHFRTKGFLVDWCSFKLVITLLVPGGSLSISHFIAWSTILDSSKFIAIDPKFDPAHGFRRKN